MLKGTGFLPMLYEKRNDFSFIIGFILITLLFVAGGQHILALPDAQMKAGKMVTHTHEVLNQLETLSHRIASADAHQRGYILTDNEEYLSLYNTDTLNIKKDLGDLQERTEDNPVQQKNIPALQKSIDAKIAGMQAAIQQKETGALKKAAMSVRPDSSLDDQIDEQIHAMKLEEDRLLLERMTAWHADSRNVERALLLGEGFLYVLICLVCGSLYNTARQRKKLILAERDAVLSQRRKAEQLEKIVGAQRRIVGHTDSLQLTLQTITDRTMEIVNADGCVVEMLQGDEMVYTAASGTAAPHIGLRLKAQTSFSGLSVRMNEILRCNDSETDDRVNREACRKVGLRSMVVVPLRHQNASIGVLKVMSGQLAAFDEESINTLEIMAGLLSAAISDAIATDAMRQNNVDLTAANLDLEKLATTDGLTGLQNRRTFQNLLTREYDLAMRYKKPLALLMMDVDYFKKYNDSFGHPAGDAVLQRVGALLKKAARTTDCVARYGGEEFIVLLPETGIDDAMTLANRIRQTIADEHWDHRAVTVSVGVSSLAENMPSAEAFLESADKALYAAKEKGRNCVVRL